MPAADLNRCGGGTNENTNGLMEWSPKRITNLSDHSHEDFNQVATDLNDGPRKVLGYRTPAEVLNAVAPS